MGASKNMKYRARRALRAQRVALAAVECAVVGDYFTETFLAQARDVLACAVSAVKKGRVYAPYTFDVEGAETALRLLHTTPVSMELTRTPGGLGGEYILCRLLRGGEYILLDGLPAPEAL